MAVLLKLEQKKNARTVLSTFVAVMLSLFRRRVVPHVVSVPTSPLAEQNGEQPGSRRGCSLSLSLSLVYAALGERERRRSSRSGGIEDHTH